MSHSPKWLCDERATSPPIPARWQSSATTETTWKTTATLEETACPFGHGQCSIEIDRIAVASVFRTVRLRLQNPLLVLNGKRGPLT